MTLYRRRPAEVNAVQFLKAGDHPAVESRWARKVEDRPACRDYGPSEVWDFYEGEPYASPLCSASTPGASERHMLTDGIGGWLGNVTPGDWIVTEGGETRVVTDEEFWRLYEMIDPMGQAVQRFLHPEALDWSGVK